MPSLKTEGGEAQEAFGGALAELLRPPLTIYLEGDLGAGKTTLVRGVLRGLGYKNRVVSPTYTLIETYQPMDFPVHHLDLYRLGCAEELEYLGLADLCDGSGVMLVEWPDRGEGMLPAADVRIRICHAGAGREIELVAGSPAGAALVRRIKLNKQPGNEQGDKIN